MAAHAKKAKYATAEERAAAEKAALEKAHRASMIFETAEEFRSLACGYFDRCDEEGLLYGEAGLCLYLTEHNAKGRVVRLDMLRNWYDGTYSPHLQDAVQEAYLRIQSQIETDPRYQEKAMSAKGIFLSKQARFGAYQDKIEQKQNTTIRIVHDAGVDASDFE